jgi:hypothetical protein
VSESARRPIGLPPRRHQPPATPAVQNLLKANRDAAEVQAAVPQPAPEPPLTATKESPQTPSKGTTIYFPVDLLKRAKATYRHTNNREMDHSWSDFINRAVLVEVERRERLYNEGNPFDGGDGKLAPGRKVQY